MRHFINEGYGWTCRLCLASQDAAQADDADAASNNLRARFFHEGEAEGREPRFAAPALARRRDASPQTLYCPLCGVEEMLDSGGSQG